MERITVNKPLAGTFRWLGVNGTEIDAPSQIEDRPIAVKEGGERTVVTDTAGSMRFTASVGKNGLLRLVQIRPAGGEDTGPCVNRVSVTCAENARFEWYRVVLGGTRTFDSCSVTLAERNGSFLSEVGYRLAGDEELDTNLEVIHLGERTTSAIHAAGVLRDRASKLFRGTIDLRRGCAGSVGNESEDVLMMDETVRSRTLPVILCGEEDVVGNHGATVGRPDEDLVYYMCSRGLPRELVYERMARAKLNSVISKIPDTDARRQLCKALGWEEDAE